MAAKGSYVNQPSTQPTAQPATTAYDPSSGMPYTAYGLPTPGAAQSTTQTPPKKWQTAVQQQFDADYYRQHMPGDIADAQAQQLGITTDQLYQLYGQKGGGYGSWNEPITNVPSQAGTPQFKGSETYNWIQDQTQTQQAQNILNPPQQQTGPTQAQQQSAWDSYLNYALGQSGTGGTGTSGTGTSGTTGTTNQTMPRGFNLLGSPGNTGSVLPSGYNPYMSPQGIQAMSDLAVGPSSIQSLSGANLGQAQTGALSS